VGAYESALQKDRAGRHLTLARIGELHLEEDGSGRQSTHSRKRTDSDASIMKVTSQQLWPVWKQSPSLDEGGEAGGGPRYARARCRMSANGTAQLLLEARAALVSNDLSACEHCTQCAADNLGDSESFACW